MRKHRGLFLRTFQTSFIVMVDNNQQTTVRQVLNDVYEDINWAYLAQNYFGKSRSWLYHKFSGRNNGKPDDFSDIDRERLKGALVDIANRLRMTADKL